MHNALSLKKASFLFVHKSGLDTSMLPEALFTIGSVCNRRSRHCGLGMLFSRRGLLLRARERPIANPSSAFSARNWSSRS